MMKKKINLSFRRFRLNFFYSRFILLKLILIFFFSSICSAQNFSPVDLYNQGYDYFLDKDYWNAAERFQEAIKKNQNYADAWFMLAKSSYEMNQIELALSYVDNASKYASDKPEYKNLRALCFITLGKFSDAEKIFLEILKDFPNNVDARFGLAELDLFNGKLTSAENFYKDALKREPVNTKALLSLALVSTELKKFNEAKSYINKALQSHSGNAEVYFVASYLSVLNGDFSDAEKKCLMAIQAEPNYEQAYELLGTIYFAQKRFNDAIDIADFRINQNRDLPTAWFIKGLAFEKLGQVEKSLRAWQTGLEVDPTDEIMRAAFELSVLKNTNIEDSRRKTWALYRVQKGKDFQKKYLNSQVRNEYQMALKLDPFNNTARAAFSKILFNDGFNENYLDQLKFLKENISLSDSNSVQQNVSEKLSDRDEMRQIQYVKLSDTIEGFESLLENTLAKKWDINPFYLDKTRYKIGIFYMEKIEPLYHADIERIAADSLRLMFAGISSTNVDVSTYEVENFSQAYKASNDKKLDYFIMLSGDETDRDVKLDAVMYSSRTGSKVNNFSVYRTGNERFTGSLLRLRQEILQTLPIRAKILNRQSSDLLLDIGKTEGIVKDCVFKIVKKNAIKISDSGVGLLYSENDVLGTVTLTRVSEEISEGVLTDTGFYDRVNIGDECVLVKMPESNNANEQSQVALDSAPQRVESQTTQEQVLEKNNSLKGADLEINRTPSLIKMINALK